MPDKASQTSTLDLDIIGQELQIECNEGYEFVDNSAVDIIEPVVTPIGRKFTLKKMN